MDRKSRAKKSTALLSFLLAVILTGCSSGLFPAGSGKRCYEASFLDLFDTVTVIKGYADSEEEFNTHVQEIYGVLKKYNDLSDIYNSYDGVVNLKTVNENAGKQPVEISPELTGMLLFGKEIYSAGGGRVNIFMGSVLSLWHEARETGVNDPEKAYVPGMEELTEASEHIDPDRVILDAEKNTVFLEDPEQSIDVGAIAKGYAAQKALPVTPESYVISLGGNICVSGPKPDGAGWTVGIQDPDSEENLEKLYIGRGSVVTSGDYQRYYILDGVRYHHIIDPETLMPADKWRSVTIVADDSGIADFLSTALFLTDREEGEKLLKKYDAEAYWIDAGGQKFTSEGFSVFLKP